MIKCMLLLMFKLFYISYHITWSRLDPQTINLLPVSKTNSHASSVYDFILIQ